MRYSIQSVGRVCPWITREPGLVHAELSNRRMSFLSVSITSLRMPRRRAPSGPVACLLSLGLCKISMWTG